MIIVIPAAGRATRFPREKWGFKPLIRIEGRPLIEYSIRSFDLKVDDVLIVIVLGEASAKGMERVLEGLEIPCDWRVVMLESETDGQAATVYEVASKLKNGDNLVIHNCDTALNFDDMPSVVDCAGLLLLFQSSLPQYSYAEIDEVGNVVRTAEKQVISNFASTGTYYFDCIQTFQKYYKKSTFVSGEHFVAPIYNTMIADNLRVKGLMVQDVFPLGTPSDLSRNQYDLSKKWVPKW